MPGWQPLPTGQGATPMLKSLRAMNAQIHGTMFASYGQIGDLTVTGDVIVGDVTGIHTLLRGDRGIIDFRDDNDGDIYAPTSYPSLLPGLVEEDPPLGSDRRYDMYLFGAEWTIGTHPWIRLTSDNVVTDNFVMIGVGALANGSFVATADGVDIGLTPGSATWPSLAFHADLNTGLMQSLADEITHVLGGNERWFMGSTYFTSENVTGAARISTTVGSVGAPSYGYQNDTDTGVTRTAADTLTLVAGGAAVLSVTPTGNTFTGGKGGNSHMPLTSGDWYMTCDDDEQFYFRDYNGTTYVNRAILTAGNDLTVQGAVRAGAVSTAALSDGYLYHIPPTTGQAANMYTAVATGSTYYVLRFNSSRRYKEHISYNKQAMLADMEIKPATFWRDDDQEWFIGLIAEDLAETDYRLASYVGADGSAYGKNAKSGAHQPLSMDKDALPDNIQVAGVLAVLAAKANRADDRWVAQQARIDKLGAQIKELTHGIHK